MMVLAGLGNPGANHAGNRHNIGFMAVDRIAQQHNFTAFKTHASTATAEGRIGVQKTLLLKPMLYMNRSGEAIRPVLDYYKLGTDALTVIHDDIDLACGKVRVKIGGGHGGHNGLRDIDRLCGNAYRRIRIGVGRGSAGAENNPPHAHVLSNFTASERDDWLGPLLECIAENIGLLYTHSGDDFMNTIARLAPPPSPRIEADGGGDGI